MLTLLVVARPNDPELAQLERLPGDVRVAAGEIPEAFANTAGEADAVLAWFTSRERLESALAMAPRVRWVHVSSAGVDTLLFPALVESPIALTNARGAFSWSLGEFALAAILDFAKDLPRMRRAQQAGRWESFDVEGVQGKTLGLVGYGDIGRAIAERARAFGMRVLAVRREARPDALADRVYGPESLLEVAALSDYLAVAAPLTDQTRGLIGEAAIRAMRPGAVLINVGRGPVVDERALVSALEEGRIRGAALDVFDREPLPAGHPFYRLENVLLSPHCADHTVGWRAQSMEVFLDNFERFRQGLPLRNVVDKRRGY
jgi:phosphoglycerate dehydrogenase-like enzyme